MHASILRQKVNTVVGVALLGSFALGASLIILHAAEMENPIAVAFAARAAGLAQ